MYCGETMVVKSSYNTTVKKKKSTMVFIYHDDNTMVSYILTNIMKG